LGGTYKTAKKKKMVPDRNRNTKENLERWEEALTSHLQKDTGTKTASKRSDGAKIIQSHEPHRKVKATSLKKNEKGRTRREVEPLVSRRKKTPLTTRETWQDKWGRCAKKKGETEGGGGENRLETGNIRGGKGTSGKSRSRLGGERVM